MTDTNKQKAENDTDDIVTFATDLKLLRQYKEFYDRLTGLGDIGDLVDIAAGGVVAYLNELYDALQASGILYLAEPEIKDLSLS